MTSTTVDVQFSVEVKTLPGEVVFVTGDCPELGNWCPYQAKRLQKEQQRDLETWSGKVSLHGGFQVKYRYLVCIIVKDPLADVPSKPDILVRRWETFIRPRTLDPRDYIQDGKQIVPSVFGQHSGVKSVCRGWLTTQTEVRLVLYGDDAVRMWKSKYRNSEYRIRVTAIDLRHRPAQDGSGLLPSDMDDEVSCDGAPPPDPCSLVEFAILGDDQECTFTPQGTFGCVYNPSNYIVFRVQCFRPDFLAFMIDIYVAEEVDAGGDPRRVGFSYVLPQNLAKMHGQGSRTVPITGMKHAPMGTMKVEFLVIQPMPEADKLDMSTCYQRHWKRRRPVDVGHRGMGTSYGSYKMTMIKENTIASLKEAAAAGADFVEFDVQLSRDKVPIIYHELLVGISMKKKKRKMSPQNGDQPETPHEETIIIPVKEFSLDQLHMLKTSHPEEGGPIIGEDEEEESEDLSPFPSLQRAFENIDPHVAFNIEVKWPMKLDNGSYEQDLEHYFDKNEYVDAILKCILQHAGLRRLIITCFDPDICIMIQRKQNKYPVQFLTQGGESKYQMYSDVRCQRVIFGRHLAVCEQLLGLSIYCEYLLKDPGLLKALQLDGLVVFVWGEEISNRETVNTVKAMGVEGVIMDRINDLKEPGQHNVFVMESRAKQTLLHALTAGTSIPTSAPGARRSGTFAFPGGQAFRSRETPPGFPHLAQHRGSTQSDQPFAGLGAAATYHSERHEACDELCLTLPQCPRSPRASPQPFEPDAGGAESDGSVGAEPPRPPSKRRKTISSEKPLLDLLPAGGDGVRHRTPVVPRLA